jgi:DGQHR domain-containing protein
MSKLTFTAVRATQSDEHVVMCFTATAIEICTFATIERIARDGEGRLSGFQRPQIASHIHEIKDYLKRDDAVLPNPIVVAFTDNVEIQEISDQIVQLTINIENGPPGLVVDGQQRLSALNLIPEKKFKVFVSALLCKNDAELRRQFVLINNTRPLPKSLIYELLPTVEGLPHRFSSRSFAADLASRLNYDHSSSLKGMIHQHTNPSGVISDTAIQRVIMNSLHDGILREYMRGPDGLEKGFHLISEFYRAVSLVFRDSWDRHKPKTSRLLHGAGIVSMGYVMELLTLSLGARTWEEFQKGLVPIIGKTAWTSGTWEFAQGDHRAWNSIQNTPTDITTLSHYLLRVMRDSLRSSSLRVIAQGE